jgi:flagellar biosynthesis protein FlhG
MSELVISAPAPLVLNTGPGALGDATGNVGGAPGKILAITSGKGGVGKTFFSANLAAALAKRGKRVLVLDADLGLANLDVVLNLYPKVTLHDVFSGKARLEDAITEAPGGFSAILAGSGMVEYSRLNSDMRHEFQRIVTALARQFDVVLLDTGAGISDVVLFTISLASQVVVVATPEPTSLTDAYATIKVLFTQQGRRQVHLVVNQTGRVGDGRAITTQLQQVLNRFVVNVPANKAGGTGSAASGPAMRLIHVGDIPADAAVRQAVMRRQLLMQTLPGCQASLAVAQIAAKLQELMLTR